MQGNPYGNRQRPDNDRVYRGLSNDNVNYQSNMMGRGTRPSYQTHPPVYQQEPYYDPMDQIPQQHYQPPPMNNPYAKYSQPPSYQQPQYQPPQYQQPPPQQPKYQKPQYDYPQPPRKQKDDDDEYMQTSKKTNKNSGPVRDFSENGIFILKNGK